MRALHWLGCIGLVCACARHPPLRFDTNNEMDAGTAHPPGIAVDPPTELPKPRASASSEPGLTVLQAPVDIAAARAVVHAFFEAVISESTERLDAVVDEPAWILTGSSGRQKARMFWRARFGALDYHSLASQVVYRDDDLETYRASDVSRLTGRRSLGLTPHDDDVLIRVPIVTPTSGATRFFADEILMLLKPRASGFVIAEMAEDFRLP